MTNIKREISEREIFLTKGGFILASVLFLCHVFYGSWHIAIIAGYVLGFMCFFILCKTASLIIEGGTKKVVCYVLVSNLKFLAVIGAVYLLKVYGFSIVETFVGIILCHALLFLSYASRFLPKKNDERVSQNALT